MAEIDLTLGVDPLGDGLQVDAAGDFLDVQTILLPYFPAEAPQYQASDYLAAIQALMPRGPVWPRDPTSVQAQLLAGLVGGFVRVNAAAAQLIRDAFPPSTVALIDEWEASLGLPDPCAGESPILQVRQAQILARFQGAGGQSVPYFVGLALMLGYVITITEYGAGNPHHWQVNAPTISENYFRVGASGVGEPLTSGGNAILECLINELKPAHTTVSFHYG